MTNKGERTILVTGSRGFLGSHLVEALPDVIEFDVKENIFHDVTDALGVNRFWQENRPQIVVHLAANPNATFSKQNPTFDAKTNILGTVNVLEASLKYNANLFIFASSAYLYSLTPDHLPISETQLCDPANPYEIGKYADEFYCRYYAKIGLPTVVIRFFNLYGPRQSKYFAIPAILERIYNTPKDGVVNVLGPPDDSRDYIFVKDAVEAIKMIIEKKRCNKIRPYYEVINIGSGIEIDTQTLCQTIAEVLNKDVKFRYGERLPGRLPGRFQADISKAHLLLGWRPYTSIKTGIKHTAKSLGFI